MERGHPEYKYKYSISIAPLTAKLTSGMNRSPVTGVVSGAVATGFW
jgi:hypothetical protein